MVVERSTSGFAGTFKKVMHTGRSILGGDVLTVRREVISYDADGHFQSSALREFTVEANLRYVNFKDTQILSSGVAVVGNAILYVSPDVDLQFDDEVLLDGVAWRLTKQVTAARLEGVPVTQSWVCVRQEDDDK